MNVILLLILVSLSIALFFLGGFIWAVKSGQFDDTCTPSMRVLMDEPERRTPVRREPEDIRRNAPNGSSAFQSISNSTKPTKSS
jgi:cbb3-type cytochrome oxidase maturation protein